MTLKYQNNIYSKLTCMHLLKNEGILLVFGYHCQPNEAICRPLINTGLRRDDNSFDNKSMFTVIISENITAKSYATYCIENYKD